MAKEFKQRKIKNNNVKYIKISIISVLVIAVCISAIVLITKNKETPKDKKISSKNENTAIENIIKNNIKNESVNSLETTVNQVDNNSILKDNPIIPSINGENSIIEKAKNSMEYSNMDAVINGIKREMTLEQVRELLGKPEKIQNEQEIMTGYTIQRYIYDSGKTQIDLINLYEPGEYIVHRLKTADPKAKLTRNLEIGCTRDEILEAFSEDNILYKNAELIVVGFKGEDAIYATSLKPKIYFRIENNKLVEVSVNIGNES